MVEILAQTIFITFQTDHPDDNKMKQWDDCTEEGKEFARKIARAALKEIKKFNYENGDTLTLEVINDECN